MLNFTDRMKRIIQLAEQALIHVQANNYGPAFDDLASIKTNITKSEEQLWEFIHTFHPGEFPVGPTDQS